MLVNIKNGYTFNFDIYIGKIDQTYDSKNAYTFNFDIYIGKTDQAYEYGLGYGVVMKLRQPLINQGCHIFFDNFYTSFKLVYDFTFFLSSVTMD